MGSLAIGVLWLGEHVIVEECDGLLEENELDDSVGDLSGPQRVDSVVESGISTGGTDLVHGGSEGSGEGSGLGSLHLDLAGLEGAQEHISKELSTGRGGSPGQSLVSVVRFLSLGLAVDGLENLIESELSDSLKIVTDEGGSPSLESVLILTVKRPARPSWA